jgi:GntR family transcriptional regulator
MTGEPAGPVPEDGAARRPAGGRTPEDVRRVLAERISAGHLRPGQRLGAERALAAELGVSRATLRQALAVLAESGVVRRVPGRGGGTFVSQDKIERDTSRVVGVPALLRSQGVVAGTRVISAGPGLSGAEEPAAGALGIQRGDLLIDLVRIRLADGSPISMERVMLPADRFPGLLELPLGGSVYELLDEHFGTRPGEAVERIEVAAASGDEALVLDVPVGSPLLAITRTTTDSDGVPFEFSYDLFRGDRIRIMVRTPGEHAVPRAQSGRGRVIELRPH